MKRLTTDTPHGNFETMMNFAYAKNGEVWIRGAGGDGEDMKLNEYIFDVLQGDKYYCEVDHPDDIPEFCLDACFCELGALFAAATQAAELRARLAAYEDTGLEPEEVEAAKKIVARLALADYPHNFQRERSDIASYMHWITGILKDAKEWWNGMVTRDE